jgi:Protein of unknown function (DUF2808)
MMTKNLKKITISGLFFALFTIRLSASAIQLSDGTTYFERPPRLIGAGTSRNGTYIWGATYYFTVQIPEDAGEPLQKLEIELPAGASRPFFNSSKTEAFTGTRQQLGAQVPLKQVTITPQTQVIAITFDPPVAPGKTVTVKIYPIRNPNVGGTYLYGVTAYPVGAQGVGQFLGFERIRIYDREQD